MISKLFKTYSFIVILLLIGLNFSCKPEQVLKIDLTGAWSFQIDSLDVGEQEKWYLENLTDKVSLPGSMTTNGKGNEVSLKTQWVGSIFDSSYYKKPEYAKYRKPNNIKVPFWLQPTKYYIGAAWYQKEIVIPKAWENKKLELFIERSHWETSVWVDDKKVGVLNSLGTPNVFIVPSIPSSGTHKITVKIDNSVKNINPGDNSHSISDHTQTNWNGMIGNISLRPLEEVYIDDVQLYPNIDKNQVKAKIRIHNTNKEIKKATLELICSIKDSNAHSLPSVTKEIRIEGDVVHIEVIYPMGDNPSLWDEFNPNLYDLQINLLSKNRVNSRVETFGMRKFSTKGTQFTINNRPTFLRGTLECAIFPKTGYPPTNVESWVRILKKCKSYGLNHIRFHSWCPPEAAFIAADQMGFYLQIESSSWANQGVTIGDGSDLDQYIYDESERMINAYGNHPSLCMMTYGNEPAGKNHVKYLTDFVAYWKAKDSRFLYTTAAGWPIVPENDFHSTSDPRIQRWGEGVKSIINQQPPSTDYDWREIIAPYNRPTISHEIGQWCVYPNFDEMTKYDGVLKPKNFEIFKERLIENNMENLANDFLMASGKLQALCYKADIEAALRTPNFGGFQLLDLHDFPGQGSALVGVLDAFWDDKGYITGEEYSRFCNSTVPLVRLKKRVFYSDEVLVVPVEVSHFGSAPLVNALPKWKFSDAMGKIVAKGNLTKTTIPIGNAIDLGVIKESFENIKKAEKLTLTVSIESYENSWDVWIYPTQLPEISTEKNIRVSQTFNALDEDYVKNGGTLLLTLKKGSIKPENGGDVAIGFSSIFWNTSWTNGQPPHTLGVLVDPKHAVFKDFPTEYHSNWQWWDAMSHSNAIDLASISPNIEPIVRVIGDWFMPKNLGLIFECNIGKGKLLVSGIDLLSDQVNRPEAKQLMFSLKKYMGSDSFNPKKELSTKDIKNIIVRDE